MKNGKILVSGGSFGDGGAERVMSILSYSLPDYFDSVVFVLWKKLEVFFQWDQRCRVIWLEDAVRSQRDLIKMKGFRSLVQQEKPNIILSFLEPFNLRVLISTIGMNLKIVVSERNDPRAVNGSWIMDQVEKLIYRKAKGIIVQTKTIYDFFDGRLRDRTSIIYNPVCLEKDRNGAALSTRKEKRIVSVARLARQKRHSDLIKAFSIFHQTHPNYILDIYGEGPERAALQSLVELEQLQTSVFLRGVQRNIQEIITSAEVFVLASEREGMSNAMIEAMCLGLPCVCTKVSGAVDLIDSGRNGFLVEIGDISGLATAMEKIVDNKELALSIGIEASKMYNILNKEIITSEWMEYLKHMAEG